ncbi:MAG: ATP-binding protein [Clostridiales bacterium]|nr:ATP-binding protein [Clostridiales bacterium]MDY5726932.1 ATP-binding protein [Eubacteriales bacterium]
MTKKIFRSIILVAIVVLLISFFIASNFLFGYYNKSHVAQLKEALSLVSAGVNENGTEYLENLDSSIFRFTLVDDDGTVLYDSLVDASEMENHLNREEIAQALESGSGSSVRKSSTLTERTFYEAVRLENGKVLRISMSQVTVGALILDMLPAVIVIAFISIVVALVLSHTMSSGIVKSLDNLDLDHPAENDAYEEITPILTKLDKQRKQINRQMQELKQKSDEFKQITASMNEGLVLLDKNGVIISINKAAKKLFGTDDSAVGRDFLTVDRRTEMSHAVEKALEGKHSEFREERNGSEYRFIINRTESEGKTVGVVILCLDVTESAYAERNRREFTANVSHELKTPLQSIIGSAELLENGLVKPEDTKRFVGNIKSEATRLVSLINDIIRLSQLDENSESASESVDLYDITKEVVEVLSASAAKKRVRISLDGEPCVMNGVRRYLYEIVYNLCDNAIRYNKEGGSVTVGLNKNADNVILKVSDTGIGIPVEHQSRVFERFYRVDKSHSKETGGTGLGLSIVKHAVAYHGGRIKLDSTVGEGTTVTVEF